MPAVPSGATGSEGAAAGLSDAGLSDAGLPDAGSAAATFASAFAGPSAASAPGAGVVDGGGAAELLPARSHEVDEIAIEIAATREHARGTAELYHRSGELRQPAANRRHIERRYSPPTSNKASLICPSDATRTVCMSSAKTLPPSSATLRSRASAGSVSVA